MKKQNHRLEISNIKENLKAVTEKQKDPKLKNIIIKMGTLI